MFQGYEELLTVDEMCEILKIGKNTAYRLLNAQKIKAIRIGRVWRICSTSLEQFVQGSIGKNIC